MACGPEGLEEHGQFWTCQCWNKTILSKCSILRIIILQGAVHRRIERPAIPDPKMLLQRQSTKIRDIIFIGKNPQRYKVLWPDKQVHRKADPTNRIIKGDEQSYRLLHRSWHLLFGRVFCEWAADILRVCEWENLKRIVAINLQVHWMEIKVIKAQKPHILQQRVHSIYHRVLSQRLGNIHIFYPNIILPQLLVVLPHRCASQPHA